MTAKTKAAPEHGFLKGLQSYGDAVQLLGNATLHIPRGLADL